MVTRRRWLSSTVVFASAGIGGCIAGLGDSDSDTDEDGEIDDSTESPDENGDTDGDNNAPWSREAVCQDPPQDVTEIVYEQRTTNARTATDPPLLEDGYWSGDERGPEERRLAIITDETTDRLHPEELEGFEPGPQGPYDDMDPSFVDETDFDASALLIFEWHWSGLQELEIQSVAREQDDAVHVYGCRFGDGQGSSGGETPAAGAAVTFLRINEPITSATFAYDFQHPSEGHLTKTFRAETERTHPN